MSKKTLWVKNEKREGYFLCPQTGMGMGSEGFESSGTYLDGGGFSRRSLTRHRTYNPSWIGTDDDINDIIGVMSETGTFWFIEPFMRKNVLPSYVANPHYQTVDAPYYPRSSDTSVLMATNVFRNPNVSQSGTTTPITENIYPYPNTDTLDSFTPVDWTVKETDVPNRGWGTVLESTGPSPLKFNRRDYGITSYSNTLLAYYVRPTTDVSFTSIISVFSNTTFSRYIYTTNITLKQGRWNRVVQPINFTGGENRFVYEVYGSFPTGTQVTEIQECNANNYPPLWFSSTWTPGNTYVSVNTLYGYQGLGFYNINPVFTINGAIMVIPGSFAARRPYTFATSGLTAGKTYNIVADYYQPMDDYSTGQSFARSIMLSVNNTPSAGKIIMSAPNKKGWTKGIKGSFTVPTDGSNPHLWFVHGNLMNQFQDSVPHFWSNITVTEESYTGSSFSGDSPNASWVGTPNNSNSELLSPVGSKRPVDVGSGSFFSEEVQLMKDMPLPESEVSYLLWYGGGTFKVNGINYPPNRIVQLGNINNLNIRVQGTVEHAIVSLGKPPTLGDKTRGRGSSALSINGTIDPIGYSSARDRVGLSLDLKEVGAWR